MEPTMKIIPIMIGICIGNFLYQYASDKNYGEAFDICFHQTLAIAVVWAVSLINLESLYSILCFC